MRTNAAPIRLAAGLFGLLGLAACNNTMKDTMAMPQPSLYDRLGGKPAIVAVVDDFVGNVAADNRINGYFAHADIPHLKMELVDQICAGTGGPCTYTGKSMKDAHKGMGVTSDAFNDLVEDLQKSLNKFKVPAKEQGDLLAVLGPMKPDIVEKM
jgi:hemoglobin